MEGLWNLRTQARGLVTLMRQLTRPRHNNFCTTCQIRLLDRYKTKECRLVQAVQQKHKPLIIACPQREPGSWPEMVVSYDSEPRHDILIADWHGRIEKTWLIKICLADALSERSNSALQK